MKTKATSGSYFLRLNTQNIRSLHCFFIVACSVFVSVIPNISSAQSCEVVETVRLGSKKNPRSKTFDNMSAITSVELVSYGNNGRTCGTGDYYAVQNRLNTKANCKANFKVTGVAVDCTASVVNSIAQTPLFLSQQSQSKPNVMFLLDDSGSMHFEIMPDQNVFFTKTNGAVAYLFPRAEGVYGSGDYTNNVASVEANAYNAITRSPQQNSIYYNPATTYDPWVKHDGTFYPDSSLTCALHNPEKIGTGADRCRDLTATNSNYKQNNWRTCNSSGTCTTINYSTSDTNYTNKSFWPATYFWYTGTDPWNYSNYTRQEIKSTTVTYSGHGRTSRDDCERASEGICTYQEEIQNFANWYTYYRSRILAARAGIGYAFSQQGSDMRVGFGTINQSSHDVDGVNTTVIDKGVRPFAGSARESFYSSLYTRNIPASGTPLRLALDAAGQYFSRSDNRGPWGETPGTNDSADHSACRRNYSVLMTDGYWSGDSTYQASTSSARSNNDGENGTQHTGRNGVSYTYQAEAPFTDSHSNTLADVAMYYWKRDLRTNLDNVVTPLPKNPAFWQHMTTFGVGLGVSGSINPDTAFNSVATKTAVAWPDTSPSTQNCEGSTCAARIDDLLHAGVNSRGGFFSAADPNEFSSELAEVLRTIAVETKSSASSIAANSTRLDTGTLIYQARFNTSDWSSELIAYDLNPDGSIKSTVWNTNTSGLIPAANSRNIFSARGSFGAKTTTGINFSEAAWASFSADQKTALQNGGSEAEGKELLNWVRGDQSNEGASGFRSRTLRLGDIINSDPFYVGDTENFGFGNLPGAEGSSYYTFLNGTGGKYGRRNMLYVGANDGMLHGFDAQTGVEKFAFIPLSVYPNLAELADLDYNHLYYVDGSPRVSDAYIGGAWKTVLVGATGAGGRAVFALDVTDPDSVGPSNLLWEFSTASSDSDKLGVAMSEPVIVRLKAENRWVAIFGNGYNSADNTKLMVLDLATGSLVKVIDTGVSGASNGLASVVPVDINNDRIADYIYAGDLQGNLWKFDFTGSTVASWDVALKSGGTSIPLFVATDAAGNRQPITARPVAGRHEVSGTMIYFGTGKYFETADGQLPTNPPVMSFYGIRDQGVQVVRGDLLQQSIVFEGKGTIVNNPDDPSDDTQTADNVRVVSNNGAGAPVDDGWYLNLVSPPSNTAKGERSVSRPILRSGKLIFTSSIPNADPCGFGGESWLMELDARNGGRLDFSAFDINDDTQFTVGDFIDLNGVKVPVSGLYFDEIIKTPGVVSAGTIEYKYTSGSSATIGVTREKGSDSKLGRQAWRKLQ
jgi:type IV pilus assembly protein PilY1